MAMIFVRTTAGNERLEGAGWHVDEFGSLHVRGAEKGNLATFNKDYWLRVSS